MTILLQNYDKSSAPAISRCLCRDAGCVRVMPPAVLWLKHSFSAADRDRWLPTAVLAAIHLAAAALLLVFETDLVPRLAFLITWGLLNCCWIALLRRPIASAALSLAMIVILIMLSQFKHGVLMMTATFVDLMLIDLDTFTFLLTIIPGLAWKVGLAAAAGAAAARHALATRSVPGAASLRRAGGSRFASGAWPGCRLRCRPTGRTSSTATTTSPSSCARPPSRSSI